jgi:hypothetical protein
VTKLEAESISNASPQNERVTYPQQIVEITSPRIFINSHFVFILNNIICFASFLGVFDFRESFILSLSKFSNKDWLLLLGDDELVLDDLGHKSSLILELPILLMDSTKPVGLKILVKSTRQGGGD